MYSQSAISSYDIPDYSYPEGVAEIELTADDGTERKIDVSHYSTDSEITVTVSKDGEVYSEEKCVVEKNLSAIRWEKRDSDGTDITAERKDGFIHMTGTFKGKPQDKTFE